MVARDDFSEVGHTGGKVTFTIQCDAEGNIGYAIGYSHASPTPASLVGIYAHPDGFACGNIEMGGIGDPWSSPPLPNCVAVLMASDSEGRFGHECPGCQKHFRSSSIPAPFPLTCPYCGLREESFHFLTPPQSKYIAHYVESLREGIAKAVPGTTSEVVIDMNTIAESITDNPRSDFYYTSTTQQTRFQCGKCNMFNDIRGKYGYCASCGWRNNADTLREALDGLRDKLVEGSLLPEDAVKQSVSEFDSAARNYTCQLCDKIPMKESRKRELGRLLFHNLSKFEELLCTCFDINVLIGMKSDREFINMMFLRRHIYEHDGGAATSRYVQDSGDKKVEEGILVRTSIAESQRFIGCLDRMLRTLDTDFHEIFPPEPFCIDIESARIKRVARPKK